MCNTKSPFIWGVLCQDLFLIYIPHHIKKQWSTMPMAMERINAVLLPIVRRTEQGT